MNIIAIYIITEISDKEFDPCFLPQDIDKYHVRKAGRGVLLRDGKIALLNVTKKNYHKLPGGGIETGETNEEGFKREILEETGCKCEISEESGVTLEYRDQYKLLQISYVYFAKVIGEPGKVNFVHDEIDDGFKLEWVPIEEIDGVMSKDEPADYEGKFIHKRDQRILEFYKNKLFEQ